MTIVEINSVCRGSTGNIMLSIARLSKGEHNVHTFSAPRRTLAPSGHKYFGERLENNCHRFTGVITGISENGSVRGTKQLIDQIEQINPDVIHLHNLHGWYINVQMLFDYIKRRHIAVVWTLHDCWGFTGQCSHFLAENCMKWKTGCYSCPRHWIYPYSLVDRTGEMWKKKKHWFTGVENLVIVTPSEWLANRVKESFLNAYRVEVINNGIDLQVFRKRESAFREKWKTGEKKIVLGVASEWSNRKGLGSFLELSERLDEMEYQIVLVGTTKKIEKKLPDNIISIRRTADRRELAEIYSAADVFVNPTLEDNFPTVNIEALACGTPVVTYNTGGSSEMIDEKTGCVVNYRDVDGLITSIDRVCRDGLYDANDCIRRAQNYDETKCFEKYFSLYEELRH